MLERLPDVHAREKLQTHWVRDTVPMLARPG